MIVGKLASPRTGWHIMPIAVGLLLAFMITIGSVKAQTSQLVEVHLGSSQTIRQIAEEFLGNPDLWPEILKASNLSSVADLKPGITLTVPVDVIAAADRAIE